MNDWCFKPRFCFVVVVLGRGSKWVKVEEWCVILHVCMVYLGRNTHRHSYRCRSVCQSCDPHTPGKGCPTAGHLQLSGLGQVRLSLSLHLQLPRSLAISLSRILTRCLSPSLSLSIDTSFSLSTIQRTSHTQLNIPSLFHPPPLFLLFLFYLGQYPFTTPSLPPRYTHTRRFMASATLSPHVRCSRSLATRPSLPPPADDISRNPAARFNGGAFQ
jgi:hypothetical protein